MIKTMFALIAINIACFYMGYVFATNGIRQYFKTLCPHNMQAVYTSDFGFQIVCNASVYRGNK